MGNLITISGIRGFVDTDGTAYLNLEDVARGLGFTQIQRSGNNTVRWDRVKDYLESFGAPTSGCNSLPEYVPENIFYRLAMKAKNEVAEAFQAKVADEILPAIRKTGVYTIIPIARNSVPQIDIAIKKALSMAAAIEKYMGVKPGIAQAVSLQMMEEAYGVQLDQVKALIPAAEHETGYLNPTEIGKRIGLNAVKTNLLLEEMALQEKRLGRWRLTDAGKGYGEEIPFVRNGHSDYQIRWKESVIGLLESVG